MRDSSQGLGRILKQKRASAVMTLRELALRSGVSASHLGRIERGERFPSARILRKLARPLGFEEDELFTLAGYLSTRLPDATPATADYKENRLDPYVAQMLGQEPPEIQRAVLVILTIVKSIAHSMRRENS